MATWSEAFAAQASSDLDAYELLTRSTLPSSHRLHYLQMWLEKLCKAYLWKLETDADELRRTHNVIAKVLPRLVSEHWRRTGSRERHDMTSVRELCREVDLLHPQVDDNDRRPDNVEYPWPGRSGTTEIPIRWNFPVAGRLYSNPGRLLLKAAVNLTRDPAQFIR